MQRNILLCGFILASLFVLIAPFGGSLDLEALTESVEVITLSSNTGVKFGTSVASCDFDGDGTKDVIIGAPDDNSGLGVVTVIFGGSSFSTVDMTDPAASGSGFLITHSGAVGFGTQVVCVGDVDGDSIDDIAIGVSAQDTYYIIYGANSYNSNFDVSSLSYPDKSTITAPGGVAMYNIVGLGDTTGDTKGDLGISLINGATFNVVVIYGIVGASVSVGSSIPSVSFTISNGVGQTEPITVASAGLFDAGLFKDFAVGNLDNGAQVAIIFGQSGGGYSDMDLSTAYSLPQVLFVNAGITYGLGESMAYAGDINGDGRGDILIGGPTSYSSYGAAFIIFGSLSFSADVTVTNIFPGGSGEGYILTHGSISGLYGGTKVFGCLHSDTPASCPTVAVCDATTTCIVILNANIASGTSGIFDMDAMKSEDGFPVYSSSVSVANPMQIAMMGDANSDGYPDFLIGQGTADGTNGKAYVVFGTNKCTSPCKTCAGLDSADWTKCTSCESGLGTNFAYNYACISSCPSHSYQNSSTSCEECNSRCLECSTTADNCDSCDNSGSYPLFYNSDCYGTCPSGAYQDSSTSCASCSGNCLECTGSSTTCTSCDTSGLLPYFYSSDCYSSCPPAAPYSYSFICYIECPSGTAANSNKICFIILPEEPDAVKTLSSINDARQISNEVMSIISSIFFSGVHSFRSQSVQGPEGYYIFLNVDYPLNYAQYGSSNFGSSGLPNPFKNTGETKTTDDGVHSVNRYLENQSLLANVGYSILLLMICLLLIPLNDAIIAVIEKNKEDYESKWYYRLLKRGSVLFRWSFLINQFISKYQDVAFFSFLGIYNAGTEDSNDRDVLNLVVCIVGFLITVAGLVGAFFIIKNVTKKLEAFDEKEKEREEYTQNDFLGRRLVLYKDLKKDKFMPMLYPFFLMARVFGFCFVTIFLCNQTAIQLTFLNLYAVLMFIYLAKYRPLEERGQLWLTFAFEIVAFIALFGVTVLAIYNTAGGTNENTRTGFGYLIIAANTGMLILNFISFFMEIQEYVVLGYKTLKYLYQKSKNKKKVTPEPSGKPRSSLEGISEKQGLISDNPPGGLLLSPNNMSEVKLSPFSTYIESGQMNDKSGFLKLESSGNINRNSAQKIKAHGKQRKNSSKKDIQESQLLET